MAKIGVLGAGTWGTALAVVLHGAGHDTIVWSSTGNHTFSRSENGKRVHPNLPGVLIPTDIEYTSSLAKACSDREVIIFAVPSVYIRSTAEKAAEYLNPNQILAVAAKGIDSECLLTMTEVIEKELSSGGKFNGKPRLAALSGPTHAEEVVRKIPTAIVAASADLQAAILLQGLFASSCMRVYTNDDIKGVEICGALKNVMALAAGMSDGLGYGDNTKAALITRGMAEITRLGLAMGCREQTFSGLAGIGDLIVTATSRHSRNNRAGYLMGQGLSAAEAVEKVGMVVEGINALPAAVRLAEEYNVEMPIVSAVNAVVKHNADPREMVQNLMQRDGKHEIQFVQGKTGE